MRRRLLNGIVRLLFKVMARACMHLDTVIILDTMLGQNSNVIIQKP